MHTTSDITARSLELFLDYARDAGNWGGTPLVGGNVCGSREDNGNLTQLSAEPSGASRRNDRFTQSPSGVGCGYVQSQVSVLAASDMHRIIGRGRDENSIAHFL
ncbi:hypothetical protein [[Mycobacterium] burgundiense]|uniref:Uncharacterized protein n=1 Tax=[Mycobacterium] burgundiense TaxID=3064286 RepID=A0ABN9NJ48_9MYCO|nr:hypothetical protein [Mycolicibacterium sp. MU0053]CAJ1505588.1 hypothetical protein MU0053_002973 [Mycolicibacterium sp. MU0053]